MRFTRPAWVIHKETKNDQSESKRLSIFSVHVHPDGSRIATGGLDAKIRIWSTKPILSVASEQARKPPKSLCTLSMHTGPVLTVRWAHSGRWLASGSDDTVVMIWDHDPSSRGRAFGSNDVNVEGWKALKRLSGHESDVTDLAWSPGDRYLASVGLDSLVLVWCGYRLERLHKLDQHQGFVKGVCWDPVGEFLATQSDDRSVKIWRTTDWQMEAEVRKPFEDSPGSTFFRRLSWSPDGAHITASNATNNKGFVFIAAVITRNTWTSEISLVGHENTVEVACYNPHIFLRNPNAPVITSNICSVVALGADDRSVSVWQTKSARPLVVAREVFERQIMDLSWSWDGLTLYAASSDGTLGVFNFQPEELEGIAPHSAQEQYLQKFGFVPPPLPEGFAHQPSAPAAAPAQEVVAPQPEAKPTPLARQDRAQSSPTGFDQPPATVNGFGEHVHKLVAKRSKKKETRPTTTNVSSTNDDLDYPLEMDVHIDSLNTSERTSKRKASVAELADDPRPSKPRTLGGDRTREAAVVKLIGSTVASSIPTPMLVTFLNTNVEGSADDSFEARNSETLEPTEVMLVSGKTTQWLDYIPSPALALTATPFYCAVGMQDGSLNIYSPSGRRLMPTLSLDSPCSFMHGTKHALMVVTSNGQLYSWNVKKQTSNFPPQNVLPLLTSSPNCTIETAIVRANGSPVIQTSNGTAHSYDPHLATWFKVSERWWSEGSDVWQPRQRHSMSAAARGILSTVESSLSMSMVLSASNPEKPRPTWWGAALTLGHLETKLHAAKVLDSPAEYKQVLLVYAKKLADEGFRAKAEELVKELFGPVYWRAGRDDTWCPTVLCFSKRELLREVLNIFVRSKTLTKFALDWQDTLKKASSDEQ